MSLNCAFAGDQKVTFYRYGMKRLDGMPQNSKIAIKQKWHRHHKVPDSIKDFKPSFKKQMILPCLLMGLLPLSAEAQTVAEAPHLLPEVIIQSLQQDPTVGRSAALSCQAIFRLGQKRAESRVQLSATIEGERELLSNLEGRFSPDELHPLGRSYNENLDNIFDGEIEARYRLYVCAGAFAAARCR